MERVCANCRFGSFFDPRQDEIERFGLDVMGCKRPNWESYTKRTSTCEAYSERDTEMTQHNDNTEQQPRCPECGGEADNGFDREYPPNPYSCTKCFSNGEVMTENTEAMREAFEEWAIQQTDWFEKPSEIDLAEGRLAWRAYQAALQSPQVTALVESAQGYLDCMNRVSAGFSQGYEIERAYKRALENALAPFTGANNASPE